MRPPPLRRPRILFFALLSVCFAVPLVLLAIIPLEFTPSIAQGRLLGEFSGLVKILPQKNSANAMTMNSVEQETGRGLKEPVRVVLEDGEYVGDVSSRSKKADRRSKVPVVGGGAKFGRHNASISADEKSHGLSSRISVGVPDEHTQPRSARNDKINQLKDQLLMARAYLLFAPPNSNSRLVRELKLRIKETDRVLAHTSKDSDLSRTAMQKMRAMGSTLSKANKAYPDCKSMSSKLRAMAYNTEEQLRAQKDQASYLIQLASRTFPKSLHCLSMRLTAEYFNLQPEEREFPNRQNVQKPDLYHYAIFTDNVLACAVVVNSTISNSMEPEKIVFHVVTDSLNFRAMKMWFLVNGLGQATIHIQSLDEFNWLPVGFSSMFEQPGVKDPRYTSSLNHLRFYLPEIFPFLNKVLLLDHDVVVQKDLRELWGTDMKGKVNGAVERCKEGDPFHRLATLVNFSDPSISNSFDGNVCTWAYGVNVFDLMEWRRQGLTSIYNKFLVMGRRRQLWKAGSLPLGQLTFYNHTIVLNRQWHLLGLGYDQNVAREEIERAAVIHYDGNMKPWLEIGIPKYRGYWSKFLKYEQPYLQQCNIHE